MANEIKIIDPFVNIPFATLGGGIGSSSAQDASSASMYLSSVLELNVGQGGNLTFRADKQGIWLGAEKFVNAPFSVSMAGLMTLSQQVGSITFTSQPTTPYHIGDLWADGSDIWVCMTERLTGVFNAGDWVLASNYKNATGVTNIIGGVVNTNFINALEITVLGTVTAGALEGLTITGGIIRTSNTNTRVEMDGAANAFNVYYAGDLRASFYATGVSFLGPSEVGGGSIYSGGTQQIDIDVGGGTIYEFNQSCFFTNDPTIDLGQSSDKWANGYFSGRVSTTDLTATGTSLLTGYLKIPVGTNLYI